jgi:hypothetical protein
MIAIRTLLVLCFVSALALGQGRVAEGDYARIELKDFITRPADYLGRRVTVTADVISIGADYQSLDVFDAGSKSLLAVSIAQLPKSQRQALINGPVTRVTVWGKIKMREGRATIKADKVSAVTPDVLARQ